MPPPQGILCDICGQKFFKHSLPIHRKKCVENYEKAFSECPKCLRKVSNDEFEEHRANCTTVRKKAMPKPRVAKGANGDAREDCPHCSRKFHADKLAEHATACAARMEKKKLKEAAGSDDDSSDESSSDEEDCREECGYCHRKFNADRIAKHEQICSANAGRKKRKPYKSSSEQRVKGTEQESFVNANLPVPDHPPSRWRGEHDKLQGIVEQGRLLKAFQDANIPLSQLPPPGTDLRMYLEAGDAVSMDPKDKPVEPGMKRCPHCSRTFNEIAAGKHIPKCKDTVNKPKTLKRVSKPVFDKPQDDHSQQIKEIIKAVLAMKTRKNDFYQTKESTMFRLEMQVEVRDDPTRAGIVRYVGRVSELFPGYWVGVELTSGEGNNNGSMENSTYFTCEEGKGLFVRPAKLKRILKLELPEVPAAKEGSTTATARSNGQESAKSQGTEKAAKPAKSETSAQSKAKKPDESPEIDSPNDKKPDATKRKPSMVDRLREEVRVNSPRHDASGEESFPAKKGNTAPPKSNVPAAAKGTSAAKPKTGKPPGAAGAGPSKESAEAARQKRIAKDAAFLEALHGKTQPQAAAKAAPAAGNQVGGGRTLAAGGKGNTAGGANPADAAAARAARAAYFDKKFNSPREAEAAPTATN